MVLKRKKLKPLWISLGAAGVNLSSVAVMSNLLRSQTCSGSCGACGMGCLSLVLAVAASSGIMLAGQRYNRIKAAFTGEKKRNS